MNTKETAAAKSLSLLNSLHLVSNLKITFKAHVPSSRCRIKCDNQFANLGAFGPEEQITFSSTS